MRSIAFAFALAVVAGVAGAGVARADTLEERVARVEQQLASQSQPSSREIQAAVDSYLESAQADARLVGGPGAAGYDGGFWIRGGSFLLRINLTIQTRYETFRWNDESDEPSPGGDLSGFSLPRVTLKFSGDATCNVHYYVELEFGHPGMAMTEMGMMSGDIMVHDFGICREAWIDYEVSSAFGVRMGLIKTAAPRQLMTPPEAQQFVDISLASASVGMMMPGYTDRNRDYGVMLHGALGCRSELEWFATVTNGDGPVTRNVLDTQTNDNFAYSARVDWNVIGHTAFDECGLGQHECEWNLVLGAWAYYYADVLFDKPHTTSGNIIDVGFDFQAGYGSWTLCGSYTWSQWKDGDPGFDLDSESSCWCVQAGYLFPGTAWQVAARYSSVSSDMMGMTLGAHEFGFAVNYYIDGNSDKLTADVSLIYADDDGNDFADTYAGYNVTGNGDAVLLRFQWQLAL